MPAGNKIEVPEDAVWISLSESYPEDERVVIGMTVKLRHIARAIQDWTTQGLVIQVSHKRRSVQVVPDEPINSPANWEVIP